MNQHKYSFTLAWSEEDNDYICLCPEFPGLSAFGTTPEIALGEAQVALSFFIESMREDGEALPEPQYFDTAAHLAKRKAQSASAGSEATDSPAPAATT
jgi:predicted RNase H-like HicB family nuclease